jgi:hypothetical protein
MALSARLEAVPFHGAAIAVGRPQESGMTKRRAVDVLLSHDVAHRMT